MINDLINKMMSINSSPELYSVGHTTKKLYNHFLNGSLDIDSLILKLKLIQEICEDSVFKLEYLLLKETFSKIITILVFGEVDG